MSTCVQLSSKTEMGLLSSAESTDITSMMLFLRGNTKSQRMKRLLDAMVSNLRLMKGDA
jgi:hypothetical protein